MDPKLKPSVKKQPERTRVIVTLTLLCTTAYFIWRIFFTLPFAYGAGSVVFGVILLVAEGIGVLEAVYHMCTAQKAKLPEMPEIPNDMYPHVDILIATHNEPEELLYKTINGCLHLNYPDKGKVHIYVCDDNNRPGMRQLAQDMGVGYFGLSGNQHAKAGNLNNALRQTTSPLVATLDADMIPTSKFLMETVPYFSLPVMINTSDGWRMRTEEERAGQKEIGFVQAPQSFYNEDMFQTNLYAEKIVPNEQDFFFREVNVGRTGSNTVIYCGSNTVISRKALEEVGYIATGSITEDFATGMRIQAKGYQSIAVDKELVHGWAPSDFNSLKKQRQRWGRGCVQTMMKREFLFGPLPLSSKISYFMALLNWWSYTSRFVYVIVPILSALLGFVAADATLPALLLIWTPYYLLFSYAIKVSSSSTRSSRWNTIIQTILFPYLILPIILETFGIRMNKFWVTPKTKEVVKNATLRYAIPHIILAILSVLAIIRLTMSFAQTLFVGSLIVGFWLVVNLYGLVCAILFFAGRINYRKDERIYAQIKASLCVGKVRLQGITADVSDSGMAIMLGGPEYLPSDISFPLQLHYKDYKANIWAKIVHVQPADNRWKYSLVITDMREEDKRAYFQMIYDRNHTLPKAIKSNLLLDTIAVIKGLFLKRRYTRQLLPSIPLEYPLRTFVSNHIGCAEITSFNYETMEVHSDGVLPDYIRLKLGGHQVRGSKREEAAVKGKGYKTYYEVQDWRQLAQNPEFRSYLFDMLNLPQTLNGYQYLPGSMPANRQVVG